MNGVGVFSILSSLQATIDRHVIKRTELISLFISAQFPIGSVGLLNLQIEKREPTMSRLSESRGNPLMQM